MPYAIHDASCTAGIHCPAGGREMRSLIETFDWGRTSLGPIKSWPQSLRAAVNLALGSSMPMAVRWGPGLIQVYNDAYADFLGSRHPDALGRPFKESWPEVWKINRRAYDAVLKGETHSFSRQHLEIDRGGVPDVGWFDMNFSPLCDDSGDIAGLLAVAVERTQEVLHERALENREAQVKAVLDQMPIGVTLAEFPSGEYIYRNDKAEELTGLRHRPGPAEGLAYHLDGRPYTTAEYPVKRVIETGQPIRQEELLFTRLDGSSSYLAVSAAAVVDDIGRPVLVVCTMEDVSGRRAAEEQQRLLLREVDHRAKNTLAVVQTLVRLTRAESISEFIETVDGRVTALARAHRLLAKSRWSGAAVESLVTEELEPFIRNDRDRAALSGPEVTLRADAAQPLGMVIYELATNATKYGALSVPGGSVSVTWDLTGEGLRIIWRETGGPPVLPPKTSGFGSELIEASIHHQLSGSATLDWKREGLVCTLVVGAEHLAYAPKQPSPKKAEPPAEQADICIRGARVLVIEDDALLALEMCRTLRTMGCRPVGPAATVVEALRLAATEDLKLAVLDMNLRGESAQPVAEVLAARGIAYAITTGYSYSGVGRTAPVLEKPISAESLEKTLKALCVGAGQTG